MRLDKFIAQQLGVSRAIAGREIRGNRVTVDGDIIKNAAFKLLPEHAVAYDGNPLAQQHGPRYFMLNKPQGYVCSTDDPDHPTVLYFWMSRWRISCMPQDVWILILPVWC